MDGAFADLHPQKSTRSRMSYLIVAVFNDELRAQQAMNELVRIYLPRTDLDNSLLLTWNGRDPIAQQSQNLRDLFGVGWGSLWGNLLRTVIPESDEIGAAVRSFRSELPEPPTSIVHTRNVWQGSIDVPPIFFRDVEALLTPGRSAIFFVSRSASLEVTAKVAHGYGGTLLSSRLTAKQLAKIRKIVRAQSQKSKRTT